MLTWVLPLCALVLAQGVPASPTSWAARYDRASRELDATQVDWRRLFALPDAAKAAFELGKSDEARQHALELLSLAGRLPQNSCGNAIHDGHMVLGRLALASGDLQQAEQELREAGKTPGSPTLNSFGPNMSLALDLLQHKRVDAVVEYFALCAAFWKLERGRLHRWTVLAKGGEVPVFGSNLLY